MSYKHDYIVYDPEDDIWVFTGYPGYYVSESGEVWGPGRNGYGCVMNQTPGNRYGHLEVSLYVDGKRIHRYVHRLVAEAFIPNPHNYPIVRHLNGDPTDNRATNLEWGTQRDNVQDSIRMNTFRYFTKEDIESANRVRRMPIVATNLKTGEEIFFISQQEASRILGINQASISDVVRGISRHAGGYHFRNDNDTNIPDISTYKYMRRGEPIKAIELATGFEYYFESQTEASRELGISISLISNILSGKLYKTKGYTFEYLEEGEFNG